MAHAVWCPSAMTPAAASAKAAVARRPGAAGGDATADHQFQARLQLAHVCQFGAHLVKVQLDSFSITKAPSPAGKATAAALTAAVVACGACFLPLLTPLAMTLLASLGIYSINDTLTNGWWLAAAAVLVLSPLGVWWWRKHQQRSAPSACSTSCSCKPADNA